MKPDEHWLHAIQIEGLLMRRCIITWVGHYIADDSHDSHLWKSTWGPRTKRYTALFINSGLFWPRVTIKLNTYQEVGHEAQWHIAQRSLHARKCQHGNQ
jgi:hypothetical protein